MISAESASWSHPVYQRVASLLGTQTGLAFPDSRIPDAEAGIRRAMSRAHIGEPGSIGRSLVH